jgi:protoheme IX farnesyltransferase
MSLSIATHHYETARVEDYIQLLKPRVMSLVVFTAIAGLLIAPGHLPFALALTTVLCIAVGAGAAGAINMWYERDVDALMTRTKNRPIPAGRLQPDQALGFGVTLAVASVILLGLAVNILSAALLAFSILFYVFVYTVWLKRRTPQNIVIGGLPGAMPPVIAWAAATGNVDLVPISLCLLTFLWTPPHFWALALYRSADYARAGIPMLPVVAGRRATLNQIFLYSLTLLPVSLLPYILGGAGIMYAIIAGILSTVFILCAWRLW